VGVTVVVMVLEVVLVMGMTLQPVTVV